MFNETITQLTTTTTNHANNFNSINNVLLENDKFLRDQVATKSDSTTVTTLSNKIDVLSRDKADKNNAAFTGTMTINGDTIATTKKTEFSLTARPGFTIIFQNCYLLNGVPHINIRVTGNFVTNQRTEVALLPFETNGRIVLNTASGQKDGVTMTVGGVAVALADRLYLTASDENNGEFDINGVII